MSFVHASDPYRICFTKAESLPHGANQTRVQITAHKGNVAEAGNMFLREREATP